MKLYKVDKYQISWMFCNNSVINKYSFIRCHIPNINIIVGVGMVVAWLAARGTPTESVVAPMVGGREGSSSRCRPVHSRTGNSTQG